MTESFLIKLAQVIKGTEFEDKVYLAGGCVRDELLGRKTNDIDITIELPDGAKRLAEYLYKHKMASKPIIYKQFGTALLNLGEHKIELVTTRKESYRSRSRKPEVAFGTLLEDVMRRDFTVNSLLKNVSGGEIIDLSGKGLADLKAGVIRATNDPAVIFMEDPLRLLRAIRFAVELDFSIEAKTFSYIKQHSTELKHISRERISAEFVRIIDHADYLKGMNLLIKSGLKAAIFPGLKVSHLFSLSLPELQKKIGSVWTKTALQKLSRQARIALIIWNSVEPELHLKQLKLSGKENRQIVNLIKNCKSIRQKVRKGILKKPGQYLKAADEIGILLDDFIDLYPLAGIFYHRGKTDPEADKTVCRKIRASAGRLAGYRFNLTGDDLIRTFCIKGAKIGQMLIAARDYWYDHPHSGKAELLQFLKDGFALK